MAIYAWENSARRQANVNQPNSPIYELVSGTLRAYAAEHSRFPI